MEDIGWFRYNVAITRGMLDGLKELYKVGLGKDVTGYQHEVIWSRLAGACEELSLLGEYLNDLETSIDQMKYDAEVAEAERASHGA